MAGAGLQMLFQRKRDDGVQKVYKHWSKSTNCEMRFSIFIPESARPSEKFHALMFLAGAYCNEQDFLNRTNFHEHASEFKIVVVCPDTGPSKFVQCATKNYLHISEHYK